MPSTTSPALGSIRGTATPTAMRRAITAAAINPIDFE